MFMRNTWVYMTRIPLWSSFVVLFVMFLHDIALWVYFFNYLTNQTWFRSTLLFELSFQQNTQRGVLNLDGQHNFYPMDHRIGSLSYWGSNRLCIERDRYSRADLYALESFSEKLFWYFCLRPQLYHSFLLIKELNWLHKAIIKSSLRFLVLFFLRA